MIQGKALFKVFRASILCVLVPTTAAPSQGQAQLPPGLYEAALHTFSVVRSGVAVDDPTTGLRHPASHTKEAALAGTSVHRDVSGGWYNAGDYGRWTNTTAIAVSYMLHLYRMQVIARHGPPADSRLLEQALWGLTWMLKMQDADGGVRHKVDGATSASLSAAWGRPPELDPNVQIVAAAATGSTATFAGAMYQASTVFALQHRDQARVYRAAADRAWNWIAQHPNVLANDLFYINHDSAGEMLWARSEHALVYGENDPELAHDIAVRSEPEVSWLDPSLLGLSDLASSPTAPHRLRAAARELIVKQANALTTAAASRPFHVALGDNEYWWGSAERVLHRAALFLMADSLQASPTLRKATLDQLAWVLGNNAVNHSFVTMFGTHPVIHPWHWMYKDYGIVLPGWAVGGPNGSPDWADPALKALQAKGTPPPQCYLDLCDRTGSWASNEGEIPEEAALLFVTGMLRQTSGQ